MPTTSELSQKLHDFVSAVLTAMGAEPSVAISESPDGFRIDVDGDGAETLLFHRGDALRAFQTIVNTTFRRELGDARNGSVEREREWVEATLGFQTYSQTLFVTLESHPHAHGGHQGGHHDEAEEAPAHEHDPVP